MKATDIVRSILDLLDNIENQKSETDPVQNEPGEQTSRFKQIFAMLDNKDESDYANSPSEIVSSVDTVTTDAGGGVNGSKDPADIRVKDPRGYE